MNKNEKYLKNSIRRLPSEIILKVFHYIVVDPMYYIPSSKDVEKENLKVKNHPKSYIFRYSYQPTFYALALTCRWMASLALPFLYMNPFIFDSSTFISTILSRQTKALSIQNQNTSETPPPPPPPPNSRNQTNKNDNNMKDDNKNICWWCLAQKQLYGCFSNLNKNINKQILFNQEDTCVDHENNLNSTTPNPGINTNTSSTGNLSFNNKSSCVDNNNFSNHNKRKLIPEHHESFEYYDYTNSINHLTTIHPSLHKKSKNNNRDQMEEIDLVNQMINDSKSTNEYQEIANILKNCHHLKTWTIYCRSGDEEEEEEDEIMETNPLSSQDNNNIGLSSSTSISASVFRRDGQGMLLNSPQVLFIPNEDPTEELINTEKSIMDEEIEEEEEEEEEEENINLRELLNHQFFTNMKVSREGEEPELSPTEIRENFRKKLDEEMEYEQVSHYLDRGVYNNASEQSGTIMLLSEVVNSSSTYNIIHNLQSASEKIFRSSNKLLCYYKNIPNHPYYTEEIDLPYQISVIFPNKNINEINADKLLNTIIDSKLVNVPVDSQDTPQNIDDSEVEENENDNDNISDTQTSSPSTNSFYHLDPPHFIQKKVNILLSHYLTHIHFASCANLSETWLNNLFRQSPNLLSVTLKRAYHISDPTICVLSQNCRELRQLTLQSYRITDLSVVALSFFCTELRSLYLNITVSDNAISWLFSRCNKIHHFRVELSIGLTGRSLEYIQNLGASKNLVELGIALTEEPSFDYITPERTVHDRNRVLWNNRMNQNNQNDQRNNNANIVNNIVNNNNNNNNINNI